MSHHLHITNQSGVRVGTLPLKRQLLRVLTLLDVSDAEWSIAIVDDQAMKALHLRTMNLPSTTDVLTFDLRDAGEIKKTREGSRVELDTVICRDEAQRRAAELGHSIAEELLLYCIHSLLHVQGYDDLKKSQAGRMHQREDELLIALGVGPVYNPAPAAQRRSSRRPKAKERA